MKDQRSESRKVTPEHFITGYKMRNTFTVVSRTFSCKFGGLKFVSSCNCYTILLHLNPLAISRNRVSRKLVLIINKQIRVDCPTIFFMGAGLIGMLFKTF